MITLNGTKIDGRLKSIGISRESTVGASVPYDPIPSMFAVGKVFTAEASVTLTEEGKRWFKKLSPTVIITNDGRLPIKKGDELTMKTNEELHKGYLLYHVSKLKNGSFRYFFRKS